MAPFLAGIAPALPADPAPGKRIAGNIESAAEAPKDAARARDLAPTRERDLARLRARIAALRAELESKEGTRREARDALRDTERAISEANRTLAALDAEARTERAAAAALEVRRRTLAQSLERQQAAIARLLRARQSGGAPGTLRIVLSGENPSAVMRDLHYLSHLSKAAGELIAGFRSAIREHEEMRATVLARAAALAANERQQRADRDRIAAERAERRQVLARIAEEIRAGRKAIGGLQADEARMTRLVEGLARTLAATPRSARLPEPEGAEGPFSALRGKLRLPVQGELAGRFGAPTGAAGLASKGVFIRAAEGRPVHAVARGQVVFSDWMRGFGNLLIVDHGGAYLSIYANNEALLKQVGDAVGAGERIATVGATGGREETGLYFELRHLGRVFDPLEWVAAN